MFGRRFKIFRLLGFDVYIDVSWFFIAVLVTWSLATGLFKSQTMFAELIDKPEIRWAMGVAGALLFFASIVLHEFAHSVVARRFGIQMRGITLFIFGGVAEMTQEPPHAKAEFWVAIAGPIMSVLLGVLFLLAGVFASPVPVRGVLLYLGFINLILVAFNMIPAFPLDGGRVLRSALWATRGDLRWATRVTSTIGGVFGILLIVFGLINMLMFGNFIGGMWWVLIGMFLRQAASLSYQHVLVRRALEGEPVRRFMKTNPIVVPAHTSIADLVQNYVYTHHHKMFPVADDGQLLGCVTTQNIKSLPPEEWPQHRVSEIAHPCNDDNTVTPETDAMEALSKMNRTGASRLLVVDQGRLVGVLTLKDLMRFMALKVELEG
jgi:Zn-dependent protease/predicted transcriptional regulator